MIREYSESLASHVLPFGISNQGQLYRQASPLLYNLESAHYYCYRMSHHRNSGFAKEGKLRINPPQASELRTVYEERGMLNCQGSFGYLIGRIGTYLQHLLLGT